MCYHFQQYIKTNDIYVEDELFDNNDSKDIKKVSDDIIETTNLIDTDVPFVDVDEMHQKR